jgi:monoterpene epsilon-lactone hydrolase
MRKEEDEVRNRFARMGGATDLASMREAYDELGQSLGMPDGVEVTSTTVAGCPAEWLSSGGEAPAVVLYFHGGGFMGGSLKSYRHLAAQIAKVVKGRALLLEYRLAPEHVFPAALDDGVAAYRHLLNEQGINPKHVSFMGDSAGSNLVVATLLAVRDAGLPLPACAVCVSPWVDYEANGLSTRTKAAADPVITRDGALQALQLYFAGTDTTKPPATILQADLKGLPPLLIQVGSDEVLLDDSTQLATRAAHHEVETTLTVWPRMVHIFPFFYPILKQGREAIEQAGAFIVRHTRPAHAL